MATIREFEDIAGWQRARELTRALYDCTRAGSLAADFQLRDQLRRAGTAAMSNIAEGFERSGTGEFIQFLTVANGSAAEVESSLYVALDRGYITHGQFSKVRSLAKSTKSLIAGFMHYLRQSGVRGVKFQKGGSGSNGQTPKARNHKARRGQRP